MNRTASNERLISSVLTELSSLLFLLQGTGIRQVTVRNEIDFAYMGQCSCRRRHLFRAMERLPVVFQNSEAVFKHELVQSACLGQRGKRSAPRCWWPGQCHREQVRLAARKGCADGLHHLDCLGKAHLKELSIAFVCMINGVLMGAHERHA